jgi:hypothetical protein
MLYDVFAYVTLFFHHNQECESESCISLVQKRQQEQSRLQSVPFDLNRIKKAGAVSVGRIMKLAPG